MIAVPAAVIDKVIRWWLSIQEAISPRVSSGRPRPTSVLGSGPT
jgi:hypothetical protein